MAEGVGIPYQSLINLYLRDCVFPHRNISRPVKQGNSGFRDRIRIMKKFIDIFGVDKIEVLTADLKKRGFNLEETHLSANEKIDSLIAILSLAFVWSHSIGEWLNDKKPIKTLKHGRKGKSLFLYGLEYLAEVFLNYEYRATELAFVFRKFEFGEFEK